jgi:dihydroorotate dehydrogenase
MGKVYASLLRPFIFRLEPETAHERAVAAMALLGRLGPVCRLLERLNQLDPSRFHPVRFMGLNFPNAVGLAAGFDKNAQAWPAAAALGFGHVEIGTVTGLAQPGNPKPRAFRYPQHRAVINRMGFNNEGSERIAARLAGQPGVGARRIPLGVNLGKSKVVDIDKAQEDYRLSFSRLAPYADYVVLNVSSPNTPGLRQLQDEGLLRQLLDAIARDNREMAARPGGRRVPVALKIAPDLSFEQIDRVLSVIADTGTDGIIATNTTLDRSGPFAGVNQAGGLSGAPLRRRSTQVIRYIARATGGRLPIIAAGGIEGADSAAEKLDEGAGLVQVYTGLIYEGPLLARDIAWALRDRQVRG